MIKNSFLSWIKISIVSSYCFCDFDLLRFGRFFVLKRGVIFFLCFCGPCNFSYPCLVLLLLRLFDDLRFLLLEASFSCSGFATAFTVSPAWSRFNTASRYSRHAASLGISSPACFVVGFTHEGFTHELPCPISLLIT